MSEVCPEIPGEYHPDVVDHLVAARVQRLRDALGLIHRDCLIGNYRAANIRMEVLAPAFLQFTTDLKEANQ